MKLILQNMTRYLLVCTFFLLIVSSCKKDDPIDDPRSKYVGEWNFKGNEYSFSSYYDYSGIEPVWTYSESSSTNFNDSTGSIQLGENKNELILKYCSSCSPVVYDLNENGQGSWTLTETNFFNDIAPAPPGYSVSYSTYNIDGWKL